jgi:hypothetical protein
VPPLANLKVNDFPAARIAEANWPPFATIWWSIVSAFVHVTESS